MEIVVIVFGLLNVFISGCIWRQFREMDRLAKAPDSPIISLRHPEQQYIGLTREEGAALEGQSDNGRMSPQQRADLYERTHVEHLRDVAKKAGKA